MLPQLLVESIASKKLGDGPFVRQQRKFLDPTLRSRRDGVALCFSTPVLCHPEKDAQLGWYLYASLFFGVP